MWIRSRSVPMSISWCWHCTKVMQDANIREGGMKGKQDLLCVSVQFSCSAVSNSLWPHGLQHARPPCPSPTPGVYSNSSPLSRWCHPAISSSVVPFSFCLQHQGLFNESALRMRWPKSWSFSFNINPSNEHSGLISFKMDWLDLFAVQGTLKSLLQHYSSKASFFGTQLSL